MAQKSVKSASNIKISPEITSFKPWLSETISSNTDNHKAEKHHPSTTEELDEFQPEQPNDSEKYFKTAKEWRGTED